ncbi:MAG: hypothetical protein ACOVQM_22415, partial [Pirellula sp.]
MRIPADKIVRIQSLGNKYEGLEARVESKSDELEKLRRDIVKTELKRSETPAIQNSVAFRAKLQQIQRQGDSETQSANLQTECDRLSTELEIEIQRLPLWNGTADSLAALAIPTMTTVERFEKEWMELDSEIKAIRKRKSDASKQHSVFTRELANLESNQSIPSPMQLEEKRLTRDGGWKLIRSEWLEGKTDELERTNFLAQFSSTNHLADAFEQSMVDADSIADQLRTDAERVANKSRILLDLKQQNDQIEEVEQELASALERQQQLEASWNLLWQTHQLAPLPPREMRSWILSVNGIVERVVNLKAKRKELAALQQKIDSCQKDLRQELSGVGVLLPSTPLTLQEMLEIALQTEKDLQAIEKKQTLYADTIAKAKVDAEDADVALAKAKLAMDAWKLEWATEMQRLQLEPNALPNQVNEVLSSNQDLFEKVKEVRQFQKRNEGIDRDAKQFVADAQQIASLVSQNLSTLPIEDLIANLTSELEQSRSHVSVRNQLEQQKKSAITSLQAAEQSYQAISEQVSQLCLLAGCGKHEDLQKAAELSRQRRDASGKIELLEVQILKNAGNKSMEDFLEEVDSEAANLDSLAPRIEHLEREIHQLRDARDEALKAIEREANALDALNKNDQANNLATE